MNFLKRFFADRRGGTVTHRKPAPIRPAQPVYVIGDIHGCTGLATQLLEQIDLDIEAAGLANPHLVFVGDYIDRGEDSAAVLELLMHLAASLPDNVTCLMGNHEKMMLDFLDRPEERGGRWLRNGGLQTLASFRVGGLSDSASPEKLTEARDDLLQALPDGTEAWLRALPLIWTSGNICVTHAGANPALPLNRQEPRTLLWGHRDFMTTPRQDAFWIVHGHTVVETPEAKAGRISVDTGACYTGRLSAAAITENEVRFLQQG